MSWYWYNIFYIIASLGLVVLVFYVILALLRYFSILGGSKNISGALTIKNILYIDENTKIVTIQNKDQGEYIIGVTKQNITLIDKTTMSIHPQQANVEEAMRRTPVIK